MSQNKILFYTLRPALSMAASPLPFPSPPPPGLPKQHIFSPFYYGLVVIGTAAMILAIYNLIVVGFCSSRRFRRSPRNPNGLLENTSQSMENSYTNLISTFKYGKDEASRDQSLGNECVVCLSGFEEGEDIRMMVRCKHSFHAPCIDMWLYSHSDCPLCRSIVAPPVPVSRQIVLSSEDELSLGELSLSDRSV